MSLLKKKIFNKTTVFQNLKTIYGLGAASINRTLKKIGVHPTIKQKQLRADQINLLLSNIEKDFPFIENSRHFYNKSNKLFLTKVKNYRSIRNKIGMPTRGQRTHTNAKTKNKLRNG